MSNLDLARSDLVGAAMRVTRDTWTDPATIKALCEAATVYADARRANASPKSTGVSDHRRDSVTMPFGRSKGKTPADCDTKDLHWYASVVRESVDNPDKTRFRDQNVALLDVIEAELETR